MPETHLSHDEFFNKLGELFTSRKGKDHGSVFLTQKRMSHGLSAPVPTKEDPIADISADDDATSFPIIVRATNGKSGDDRKAGKKVKLSTVVPSDSLDAFYGRYAEICKAGMLALKPRDRSKRKTKGKKKKTATAAA
ncbi:Signal recognition particle subunit srp14 [Cytospora mali]|uniref:Signal recognition particle subunit SRP14 n=1 Tax=Cytospora mali TaxID=578113 RepID=A0A194VE13_CYTMA|nr:Signal recognition particle subunit srp14 [Valsa mali var. pyri (nom. inval.)]